MCVWQQPLTSVQTATCTCTLLCNKPRIMSCQLLMCMPPVLQVAALAPDELVGDNQYFCDYCAAKSDADRRMRLRSLPPYLCLALQRFTYDYQVCVCPSQLF